MIIKQKFTALSAMACIVMLSSIAYGGYLGGDERLISSQDLKGGTESILYRNDTVMLDNTVTEEARPLDPPKTELVNIQMGVSAYYSSNVLFIYLPLGYTITERIAVNASIPYVKRDLEYKGETYSASGLGDIKVGGAYFTLVGDELTGISGALKDLQGVTYLNVTVPTGDAEAEDKGVPVPLGSGGFSFNLKQTLTKKIEMIRVFGNISIIYSLPAEYKPAGGEKITEERGAVVSLLLGGEYTVIENLSAYLKLNYVYIGEGQQKIGGTWYDSNDALQTIDIIPGAKYSILPGTLSAYLALVVPVYTKNDPDAEDPENRGWGVNFGVTGIL